MTKKNKIMLLISSVAIVIPSVLALILHELVEPKIAGAWHFSWIMPVILVAVHVLLHLITFRENELIGQSEKIVNITYWMIPVLSFYVSALFMMLSFGLSNVIGIAFSVIFGTMFIFIGNYMPKAKQNRTFGVKIKWTLANDENWAATHRVAAKTWVITGAVVLLGAFFPEEFALAIMLLAIIPAVFVPVIYSYCFYKKQIAQGSATKEEYSSYPKSKLDKKTFIISTVIGSLVLVFVVIIMFVGSISYTVGDDELEVKTTFGGGMTLDYDDIVSVEYREEEISGMRVSGFASGKLLFGWFKNDEYGDYTRYTYVGVDASVIIRTKDTVIVLGDESVDATRDLYSELVSISEAE